jgi:REP element-mobilizing transposase RayT
MEAREGSGGRPDRHFHRTSLGHVSPPWVKSGGLYFVTICTETRGENQLCVPETAEMLLESAAVYHERQRWFARLFLLMPDHVHALLAFPPSESMSEVIRNWKSYTARKCRISWQKNFFDHRIRDDEQWELKARYIRENPLRKALVQPGEDWPWKLEG